MASNAMGRPAKKATPAPMSRGTRNRNRKMRSQRRPPVRPRLHRPAGSSSSYSYSSSGAWFRLNRGPPVAGSPQANAGGTSLNPSAPSAGLPEPAPGTGWRWRAGLGNIRSARTNVAHPLAGGTGLMRRLLPLNLDAALLILRVVLGVIMLYHGWPKLTDLGGTIEGFTGMGIPLPALSAIFATVAEVGGGLLLLLGAFTDIAGLLVAIDMLGAIVVVHAKNGFAVN